jgi:hypothetical protein
MGQLSHDGKTKNTNAVFANAGISMERVYLKGARSPAAMHGIMDGITHRAIGTMARKERIPPYLFPPPAQARLHS